ncbi:hypothetical protein, partial [Streptomyces endophyticus]
PFQTQYYSCSIPRPATSGNLKINQTPDDVPSDGYQTLQVKALLQLTLQTTSIVKHFALRVSFNF